MGRDSVGGETPSGWGSALRRLRTLSNGPIGTTVLVEGLADGRLYALKRVNIRGMTSRDRQQAVAEVRQLSSLRHPFILSCYGSFEEGGHLNILADYAGADLSTVVSSGDALGETKVLEWVVQLALALEHSHRHHILHRDVRSSSIHTTTKSNLKLGDYGVHKILERYSDGKESINIPFLLAPEVVGGGQYDARSEVWALGCIAVELCCRELVFDSPTASGSLYQRLLSEGELPWAASYSAPLKQLLRTFTHPDPTKRPTLKEIILSDLVHQHLPSFSHLARSEVSTFASRNSSASFAVPSVIPPFCHPRGPSEVKGPLQAPPRDEPSPVWYPQGQDEQSHKTDAPTRTPPAVQSTLPTTPLQHSTYGPLGPSTLKDDAPRTRGVAVTPPSRRPPEPEPSSDNTSKGETVSDASAPPSPSQPTPHTKQNRNDFDQHPTTKTPRKATDRPPQDPHPTTHTPLKTHDPHPTSHTPLKTHDSHPTCPKTHDPHPTSHTPLKTHDSHPTSHTPLKARDPHPTSHTPLKTHDPHPTTHTPLKTHDPHPTSHTPLKTHDPHPTSHTPLKTHDSHPTSHTPLKARDPHPTSHTPLKTHDPHPTSHTPVKTRDPPYPQRAVQDSHPTTKHRDTMPSHTPRTTSDTRPSFTTRKAPETHRPLSARHDLVDHPSSRTPPVTAKSRSSSHPIREPPSRRIDGGQPKSPSAKLPNSHNPAITIRPPGAHPASPPPPPAAPRAAHEQSSSSHRRRPPELTAGRGLTLQEKRQARKLTQHQQRMAPGGRTGENAAWMADAKAQLQQLSDMLAVIPAGGQEGNASRGASPQSPPSSSPPPQPRKGSDSPQYRARHTRPPPDRPHPQPRGAGSSPPSSTSPPHAGRLASASPTSATLRHNDRAIPPPTRKDPKAAQRQKEKAIALKEAQTRHRMSMKRVKARVTKDMVMNGMRDVAEAKRDDENVIIISAPTPTRAKDGLPASEAKETPRDTPREVQREAAASAAKQRKWDTDEADDRRKEREKAREAFREARKSQAMERRTGRSGGAAREQEWAIEIHCNARKGEPQLDDSLPLPSQPPAPFANTQPALPFDADAADEFFDPSFEETPEKPKQKDEAIWSTEPPQGDGEERQFYDPTSLPTTPRSEDEDTTEGHSISPPPPPPEPTSAAPDRAEASMRSKIATRIECLRESLEGLLGADTFLEVYRGMRTAHAPDLSTASLSPDDTKSAERMLYQLMEFEDMFYG